MTERSAIELGAEAANPEAKAQELRRAKGRNVIALPVVRGDTNHSLALELSRRLRARISLRYFSWERLGTHTYRPCSTASSPSS